MVRDHASGSYLPVHASAETSPLEPGGPSRVEESGAWTVASLSTAMTMPAAVGPYVTLGQPLAPHQAVAQHPASVVPHGVTAVPVAAVAGEPALVHAIQTVRLQQGEHTGPCTILSLTPARGGSLGARGAQHVLTAAPYAQFPRMLADQRQLPLTMEWPAPQSALQLSRPRGDDEQ